MYVLCVLLDLCSLSLLQTELIINTHTIVADIHQNVLMARKGPGSQGLVVSVTYTLSVAE